MTTAVETEDQAIADKSWMIVFVFAFLALLADGADVMYLALSLPSLKQEFSLTNVEAGALGSITLAAMAVGGIYGGWACDRFGRVRTLSIAVFLFSIGTGMLGLTHNYWQFAVVRFFGSLGLGAVFVCSNTLMFEYAPAKYRTTVLGALQSGWTIGYVVASLVASFVIPDLGWRYLFFTSIVPVVVALGMQLFVREPACYLEAKAARAIAGPAGEVKQASIIKQLLSDVENRKRFVIWTIATGLLQFGYYGVVNWMPSYLQEELHMKFSAIAGYMMATFLASTLGKISAGWLADKIGCRAVFFIANASTAAFIPIVVFWHSPSNIAYLMTLFGFFYGMPFGVTATYMGHSFDTSVRGLAIGATYNIGRLGGVAAPLVIGYLATGGNIGTGFLVMCIAFLLCGLVPSTLIRGRTYAT